MIENKILDALSQVKFSNAPKLLSTDKKEAAPIFENFLVIIENGTLKADNILFRGLNATNLTSKFYLKEGKIVNMDDQVLKLKKLQS